MPSAGLADYYHLTFKARATIKGKNVSVSRFEITYSLNQFAYGELAFPIGRQMLGDKAGQSSDAEGFLTELEPYTAVELFVEIVPGLGQAAPPGKGAGFPSGEFMVFTGFSSMPSFTRVVTPGGAGTAELVLQVVGTTAALAGATQCTAGAQIFETKTGTGLALSQFGDYAPESTLYDTIMTNLGSVKNDIWGLGIQPLMEVLLDELNAFNDSKTGVFAQQALDRLNSGGVIEETLLSLNVNMSGAAATLLDQGLIKTIVDGFYSFNPGSSGTSDFWSVLQNLRGQFLYNFIPTVKEDAISPVLPCLGGEPFLIIDPNEYFYMKRQNAYERDQYALISEVGLVASGLQSSGWQASTAPSQIVGRGFVELPSDKDGRLVLFDAPAWITPRASPARNSLGVGSAVEDAGNTKKTGTPSSEQGASEKQFLGEDIGNLFAETILFHKLFSERSMFLTGRFRVDCCPGSLIRVNTAGEKFGGKSDSFFGMMDSITLAAGDGGNGSYAQTTFHITHVRSKSEHADLTSSDHPLYGEAFRGGKLLDF